MKFQFVSRKNLILVFLLAITVQMNVHATNPDTLDFTVVAPSGLSLRTAPYMDANRLEVLPYGTAVKTVGDWEELYTLERLDTIDSRVGYWIETAYNGQKGFIFSGYLKNGPLFVPPTDINNQFRITVPGERCQSINYDPSLHWYGIYLDPLTGDSKVKEVDIEIAQTKLSMEDEEMAYADYADFLNVKASQRDSFLMFFGTPEKIDNEHIAFEKSYFENLEMDHWDPQGKFIYPYERVQIAQDDYDPYYLVAYERIVVDNETYENHDDFTRKYSIYLSDNREGLNLSNGDTVCLDKALNTEHLSDYQYATHLGPRLVWQGDINNDGFPDVLFYTPYMSECCGGSITYHLLVSEWKNGKWSLKKAAEDQIFSCFGC